MERKNRIAERRLAAFGRCIHAAGRAAIAAVLLAGCASKPYIAPARDFAGLADLLGDTRADAGSPSTLNVFIVHGMRAQDFQFAGSQGLEGCRSGHANPRSEATPELEKDVRGELVRRLQLQAVPEQQCVYSLLGDAPPDLQLAGRRIWSDEPSWKRDSPKLEVAEHTTLDGSKTVVFYAFNYWPLLVRLKCDELVAPDRILVGETNQSRYCAHRFDMEAGPAPPIKAADINKMLKSEIVTWGVADGAILSSEVRPLIRAALREAMEKQFSYLAYRGLHADLLDASFASASGSTRWAVITKSLGSYVVFDALLPPSQNDALILGAGREQRMDAAAFITLCAANQIHMLANQYRLLRLGEISSEADGNSRRSIDRCDDMRLRPLQVVAYHDPSDMLTFPLPLESDENLSVTNVITRVAKPVFPFALADPMKAHDGQKVDRTIMDLVAFGYRMAD